ncbi:MAG TPA: hypothetical protein VGR62_08700 [Candidatus Binatia bacterium]|nr:hypothetical protein [Candidatus Binatia bacterium]
MARPWVARCATSVPDDFGPVPPGGPLGTLLAQLLWNRGIVSAAAADAFLEPTLAQGLRPPAALAGIEEAAAAIAGLLAAEGRLRVGAASELDAILAAAVTVGWLRDLGLPAEVVIGDVDDGCRVVFAHDALVVHVPPAGVIRVATAATATGDVRLGIAGVAFYLLIALRRALRTQYPARETPDPRSQLDVAALGGLASGSVLRDEERVLVALGLRRLQDMPRPGLQAVSDSALIARPTARAVERRILPRLAAAIRLGEGERVLALLDARTMADAAETAAGIELAAARWAAQANAGFDPPRDVDLEIDAEWPLAAVTPRVALTLGRLEPHGPGNPEPVLVARGARLDGARLAGDPMRPYWRLRLRQDGHTLRATAQGLRSDEMVIGALYDVAYTPRLGQIRGGDMLELVVHDLQPTTEQDTRIAKDSIVS